MHPDLWHDTRADAWQRALDRYDDVIVAQGVASLPALDDWYQQELPAQLQQREHALLSHDEMVRITEWKMARGVWRARNLVLVRGNHADLVEQTTREALSLLPADAVNAHMMDAEAEAELPWSPIAKVAELAGVGPATASAVIAAAAPACYPFLDELVAAQVAELGPPAFSLPYYRRYAVALRVRARALGGDWTPARVERALWAHVGGKSGAVV